jgi:hypothetical protein
MSMGAESGGPTTDVNVIVVHSDDDVTGRSKSKGAPRGLWALYVRSLECTYLLTDL